MTLPLQTGSPYIKNRNFYRESNFDILKKRSDPLHKKLLRKSGFLRERSEIHINETGEEDDMTIKFSDFAHYIGSKISPTAVFNAHFRPQFKGCAACNFRQAKIKI